MAAAWTLSIGAVQAAFRSGALTPSSLARQMTARAAALSPELNAYTELWPEAARAQADALEQRADRDSLPLWGIPVAHKDIFARPGRQPGCGVAREMPGCDFPASRLISRLNDAGAVELGLVNLAEFALGTTGSNKIYGDARNPWDLTRCSGGSSSGSAVAVAAGLAFASVGTDSGASVRVPASLCGVVGYMPAPGVLESEGCFPLSWSVDRPGVIARTVQDCALVCDIAGGTAPAQIAAPCKPLRIGVPATYYTSHLCAQGATAYEQAIRYCSSLGHEIVDVQVVECEEMRSLHRAIMRTEAAAVHRDLLARHGEFYDLSVRKFITGGEGIFAVDYIDALRLRGPLQRAALETTYSQCDLVITPTAPSAALRYSDIADVARADVWQQVTRLAHYTQPASYLGFPAISVPFTLSGDGLPVGIQFIAPAPRTQDLLSLAYQFQTHWRGLDLWPPHAA